MTILPRRLKLSALAALALGVVGSTVHAQNTLQFVIAEGISITNGSLRFSDFAVQENGNTSIPTFAITVSTAGNGLQFLNSFAHNPSIAGWVANAGDNYQMFISYRVTPLDPATTALGGLAWVHGTDGQGQGDSGGPDPVGFQTNAFGVVLTDLGSAPLSNYYSDQYGLDPQNAYHGSLAFANQGGLKVTFEEAMGATTDYNGLLNYGVTSSTQTFSIVSIPEPTSRAGWRRRSASA